MEPSYLCKVSLRIPISSSHASLCVCSREKLLVCVRIPRISFEDVFKKFAIVEEK
jgi:hypothetical protein